MIFDRTDDSPDTTKRLLGVGHKAVDAALAQARGRTAALAMLPTSLLQMPLVILRVQDRVTDDPHRRPIVVGAAMRPDGSNAEIVVDWKLLRRLNGLPWRKKLMREPSPGPDSPDTVRTVVNKAMATVRANVAELAPQFRRADVEPIAVLWCSCE
jgi:hypothetical protein